MAKKKAKSAGPAKGAGGSMSPPGKSAGTAGGPVKSKSKSKTRPKTS